MVAGATSHPCAATIHKAATTAHATVVTTKNAAAAPVAFATVTTP